MIPATMKKAVLLIGIVFFAFPVFAKAQTSEDALWREIRSAWIASDVNSLRNIYDTRKLDIDFELPELYEGWGRGSLLHHMLQSLDSLQNNKQAETVTYFLLERCANTNIKIAIRKRGNSDETLISLSPLELLRYEKAEDERDREESRIAIFQRLIDKFSNLQTCSKATQKSNAPTDNEQVSTTDWVEKFSVGNSSVIMVRNNSKTRRIIVKGSDVFQCENVAAGGCGFKTEGWIIAPGEILSLRVVPPSESKQSHSFQYQYWAEFAK